MPAGGGGGVLQLLRGLGQLRRWIASSPQVALPVLAGSGLLVMCVPLLFCLLVMCVLALPLYSLSCVLGPLSLLLPLACVSSPSLSHLPLAALSSRPRPRSLLTPPRGRRCRSCGLYRFFGMLSSIASQAILVVAVTRTFK